MFRTVNIIVWLFIIVGLLAFISGDTAREEWFYVPFKLAIELYLFGFTSFLIFKRVFFYKIKGNIDVIRLVKKSDFQSRLLLHSFGLVIIYLTFNQAYYGTLIHANTIIILILLLYYVVQVALNSHPSLYIDEQSFAYDDFFVQRWPWQEVRRIELADETVKIVGDDRDFELDFNLVDEIDYIKFNTEVEHRILDGDFSTLTASTALVEILQNYANRYNLQLVNSATQYKS